MRLIPKCQNNSGNAFGNLQHEFTYDTPSDFDIVVTPSGVLKEKNKDMLRGYKGSDGIVYTGKDDTLTGTPVYSNEQNWNVDAGDREGARVANAENSAAQNIANGVKTGAYFIPGVSNIVFGTDLAGQLYNKDYKGAALSLGTLGLAKGIGSTIKGFNKIKTTVSGSDGKIFNSQIPYNQNYWYRGVGKDAIVDANKSGLIRGSGQGTITKGEGSGPWFGRGKPGFIFRDYVIEGNPNKVDFIDAQKYQRGQINILPKTAKITSGQSIYDSPFEYGKEGFPITNGDVNATPVSNFIYYKKYPLLGWRQKQFKQ